MENFPWLTVLMVVPLIGAIVVALLPSGSSGRPWRPVALGVSLVTLLISIGAALQFTSGSADQFQLVEKHQWIPQFGVSYALGVDGIALSLIVMSAILVPVCLLAMWDEFPGGGGREKNYFALTLLLEAFIVGVFAATDVFLFYVFFEAMLIPVYFLIGWFGGEGRQKAALKFLLFSLAGGLVMLAAVIGVYFQGPQGGEGFLVENLTGLSMGQNTERLLFLGFFIAFAVKAPMWPVHTWLPDAAAASRPATATLLVGVLDKVGTFGMIRFCLQLFPNASQWATPAVIVLAIISIVYGAVLAIGQDDLMRLIAYTSISHFGFIVLGIFVMTSTAGAGASLYMINHGFGTAALFLIAGMLIARRGSTKISDYGGWQKIAPGLAGVFLLSGLAGLALPGLGSFVSEFLVIVGSFQHSKWAGAFAVTGMVLAATYIMWLYKRMMTGPTPELATPVRDITIREKVVVAPLIAAFLVLGFFPKPVLDVINPAVQQTLQIVGVSDPQPTHPTAATTGSNNR